MVYAIYDIMCFVHPNSIYLNFSILNQFSLCKRTLRELISYSIL